MKHILLLTALYCLPCSAQNLEYAKKIINDLCSSEFKGRGYIDDGVNKAASYLENEFKHIALKKFGNEYFQSYSFSVNTHPFPIRCQVDEVLQQAGISFLVDAASKSISGKYKLLHFNTKDSLDKILLFKKIQMGFEKDEALVLHFLSSKDSYVIDSCKYYHHVPELLIRTEAKKLTHTIRRQVDDIASLIFIDSVLINKELIDIDLKNEFIDQFPCKNIIAYIDGENNNQYMVFSAHYDHLGMQGKDAMFPGASDNASGVSMLMYLADYYSKHKPLYKTIFILFSGEEAGLLGSEYFTSHPTFDLQKIKMLINIDIMGNAEKGIVVVNGELYKQQYEALKAINDRKKYLPEVRIRGKAKNSDHYYFSELGIPSFFIYSDGGLGYYHDVYDKANSIALTNYENVAKLLIEYAGIGHRRSIKTRKHHWWQFSK